MSLEIYTPKQKELLKQSHALQQEVVNLTKSRRLTCPFCKTRVRLDKLLVVRENHYITPRGCTDGDYWVFSREYAIFYPCCDKGERVYRMSGDEDWRTKELTEAAKKQRRVQLYNLIHAHISHVDEVLDRYDETCSVDELRKRNQEKNK